MIINGVFGVFYCLCFYFIFMQVIQIDKSVVLQVVLLSGICGINFLMVECGLVGQVILIVVFSIYDFDIMCVLVNIVGRIFRLGRCCIVIRVGLSGCRVYIGIGVLGGVELVLFY